MAIRRLSKASITSGAKSSKMWDQETSLGFYESIATVVVDASGQGVIDITNIPQNYTNLQVRIVGRCTQAGSGLNNMTLRFNTDGAVNYTYHVMQGNGGGSVFSANGGSGYTNALAYFGSVLPQASVTANFFGAYILDILDYTNTSKLKVIRSVNGADLNGSGNIALWSNLWNSTAAINQLTFYTDGVFTENTQIALYGIRGA
jgi:hypothetical protein